MAGMKSKVSSLTVLRKALPIFPDEIIYIISKFHGRWVHYVVPRSVRVKVKQPRTRHTHKKHLISHYYM